MTKEQYYEGVLKNREIAADPKMRKCPCPDIQCEWHGRCKECVTLHRYYNDHIPACLQPIIEDKLTDLINVVEMTASKKEGTPAEHRNYAKERDKENK